MSIGLATKGIISQVAIGGGGEYPVYIYIPMEEPSIQTDEIGFISIYGNSLETSIRSDVVKPSLSSKELKPVIRVDTGE